jgi:hypothetical protein
MAITKLKRGENYFYVDGWKGVRGEPGVMVPARVNVIEAVTGGAKAPKVRYSGSSRHWKLFLDKNDYGKNAVWATREEAEAAVVINTAVKKLFEGSAA